MRNREADSHQNLYVIASLFCFLLTMHNAIYPLINLEYLR